MAQGHTNDALFQRLVIYMHVYPESLAKSTHTRLFYTHSSRFLNHNKYNMADAVKGVTDTVGKAAQGATDTAGDAVKGAGKSAGDTTKGAGDTAKGEEIV